MRGTSGLLALALCLLLTACGAAEEPPETADPPAGLMEAVCRSQEGLPELETLTPEDPAFGEYLTAYYRLSLEEVEDGIIRCASGMSACELAVLRFSGEADLQAVETALLAYQESRAGDFTGYLPEEAALVEDGLVVLQGRWAALLLCPEPEAAREALLARFDPDAPPLPERPEASPEEEEPDPPPQEEPEPPEEVPAGSPAEAGTTPPPDPPSGGKEPPETPEPPDQTVPPPSGEYDHDAVLAAVRSGDSSGLSEKSRAVLEAANAVLDQTVTGEMNDYEKELAIHDWMLDWGRYDHETLSRLPGQEAGADSGNPYGFLVGKAGICTGYAATFQLFMELLGVECVLVEGTAHAGTADHAWNLVRLDGEWYGVDVTWDDPSTKIPVSEETAHRYFNVTSAFLRGNDHQWTEEGVPEAEGTAWAWQP